MIAVTAVLFQRVQELAIPIAASVSQLCVATILGITALVEANSLSNKQSLSLSVSSSV